MLCVIAHYALVCPCRHSLASFHSVLELNFEVQSDTSLWGGVANYIHHSEQKCKHRWRTNINAKLSLNFRPERYALLPHVSYAAFEGGAAELTLTFDYRQSGIPNETARLLWKLSRHQRTKHHGWRYVKKSNIRYSTSVPNRQRANSGVPYLSSSILVPCAMHNTKLHTLTIISNVHNLPFYASRRTLCVDPPQARPRVVGGEAGTAKHAPRMYRYSCAYNTYYLVLCYMGIGYCNNIQQYIHVHRAQDDLQVFLALHSPSVQYARDIILWGSS